MSYHAPDLTGIDPLHRILNDVHSIFAAEQKIFFGTAVFADSIELSLIGTVPTKQFVEGVDWEVRADDYDTPTISRVKVYESTFNKRLVRSITIIHPFVNADYLVNANYQRLYPNQIRTAIYNNETLAWTPPLAVAVLEELDKLRLQVSRAKDVSSPESDNVGILEVDIDQSNLQNKIYNEKHELNTVEGVCYIQPIYGSFYNDRTLVVRYPATNRVLVKDIDYRVVGINVAKTKITASTSSVFDFILITTEIVGVLEIDYHAFGGEASLANFKELLSQIRNMTSYMNEAQFVTETTLGHTSVINAMTHRIVSLEENMRRLLSGTPSYGDKTSGVSRLVKVTAEDSSLHWWNLATLYKVDGSDDIVNADRMHLRISTLYSKFMMDVYISANMNNPADNKFAVSVASESYPRGYVPFVDYSGVDNILRPQFRILWNEDSTRQSGITLQIGLELKRILTETIAIEDFSGAESCWILLEQSDEAFAPLDSVVELPARGISGDPAFVWDLNNPNSRQESTLVPFSQGHLVWAGSMCLNRPGGWQHFSIPHFLEHEVDYRRIKKIRLELSERGSYKFPLDIPVIPGVDTITGTATASYYREPLDVMIQISRDELTGDILIDLNTNVIENGANALDLMGLVIYT